MVHIALMRHVKGTLQKDPYFDRDFYKPQQLPQFHFICLSHLSTMPACLELCTINIIARYLGMWNFESFFNFLFAILSFD